MAYTYLLNLYDEIEKKIKVIDLEKKTLKNGADSFHHDAGRLDILNQFKHFLSENLNDKLPKRIRKKMIQNQ